MSTNQITIGIVGAGGDGVITLGDMLVEVAARQGLHVVKTDAYGAQIRGGESSTNLRIGSQPLLAPGSSAGLLVVFSEADFARFKGDVAPADDAVILCEGDPAAAIPATLGGVALPATARLIPVPFVTLATEAGARGAKNLFGLGLIATLVGLPSAALRDAVRTRFKRADAKTIESNLHAFDSGIAYAEKLSGQYDLKALRLTYEPSEPHLIMSGNEASAVGVLHAGCRFFAGYPITPSSEMLHFLAEWMPKMGGKSVQTEDEISALGAVVGASFAGEKAMTATSGPGLSLMTELLGLSTMAEVPVVIVNVQRGGPSTGLPTKNEQTDLFQAAFGGHGDLPRVVIGCGTVEESFHATVDAFNIAEEYQLPVIVLSDQAVAQRRETVASASFQHEVRERRKPTAEELVNYRRYRITDDGVSPMASIGMKGGEYQTNGLEHDESGKPSATYVSHEKMNEKRYRKLTAIKQRYCMHQIFGADKPEVGVLCWGSSVGPVREAAEMLNARGHKIAVFATQLLSPFPAEACEEFIASVREVSIVELSYAGQFHQYLRSLVDLPKGHTHHFKRSGGRVLTTSEVEAHLGRICGQLRSAQEMFS